MNPESDEKSTPEKSEPHVTPSTVLRRMRQAPWWAVSLAFHALAIALVSLISWTVVYHNDEHDFAVTTPCENPPTVVTELCPPPSEVLRSSQDTPPTDPSSTDSSDIVVPPDILSKAELGDHFESLNLEHPDLRSAFGTADAHMFHSVRGNDGAAGAGGMGGSAEEDLIGANGSGLRASLGSGGGWGGGHGTGVGVDAGQGYGTFGNRNGCGRSLMARRHGGSVAHDIRPPKQQFDPQATARSKSFEAALAWLATNQEPDGRWNCREHSGKSYDTAVTGLALLAFLRAGQSDTTGRYHKNVQLALQWLKTQQHANGHFHDNGEKCAYSHAIAGLSMAEAAKISTDESVRAAADRALKWSCNVQQPSDSWEAWNASGTARQGDLGITSWYLMQLTSARAAGITVPDGAFNNAGGFVGSVSERLQTGEVSYYNKPGGATNPRLNAIGGVCTQLLGLTPVGGGGPASLTTLFDANRPDLYNWYYGSLYAAQRGGTEWPGLYQTLQHGLTNTQNQAGALRGSWDPAGDFAEQWGRVGQTALGALCLETLHGAAPSPAQLRALDQKDGKDAQKNDPANAPTPDQLTDAAIGGESYEELAESGYTVVQGDDALSTFAIDVDTASYSNVRRMLVAGQRPPKGAVRIEELINYFPYDYKAPEKEPFSVQSEIADCPWNPQHRLALVNLKAREIPWDQRPRSNLVFLVDVSGSMFAENRLPLVKKSLDMLVDRLGEQDSVGIVVYAGETGVRLDPVFCDHKAEIKTVIDSLGAGGGTNGGAGIVEAYRLASKNFIKGGTNRVILCTDGDFNIGVTNQKELQTLITDKAKSGVFLSVMGFGMGNLKDSTMEMLADKGNGNYGYIDSEREAKKIMVDQIGGTLLTLCKDVKIQVEFNPSAVTAYRLVGYENRLMAAKEFRDDKKDAGELGSGHTVTALYEIVTGSSGLAGPGNQPLKYQKDGDLSDAAKSDEIFMVSVRHKLPEAETATEMNVSFSDKGQVWKDTTSNFRWAASVAMYGMLLRGSEHKGACDWSMVRKSTKEAVGNDPGGYRAEFLQLLDKAEAVSKQPLPKDDQF